MDLQEEIRALSVAVRRYQEETLLELRRLREELEEERRQRRAERWLFALTLVAALVGWWR